MTFNEHLFTSNSSDYNTPKWLLEHLYEVFTFDLDPCSDAPMPNGLNAYVLDLETQKIIEYTNDPCAEVFLPNVDATRHYFVDGLELPWFGTVFMNPPYGREISKWFHKAATCSAETVVCLVPARTDTRWWQDNMIYSNFTVFIRGRLKFGDETNSAPFPSAIVVFGKTNHDQREHLMKLGCSCIISPQTLSPKT